MTVHTGHQRIPAIPPDPSPGDYQRLAREISSLEGGPLEPLHVAMLASSTLNFLRPVITVEGARAGFGLDLFLGEFGQLEQPVLDGSSELYSSSRDVLVLAFQPDEVAPTPFDRYHASNGNDLDALCAELTGRLLEAAKTFRNRTGRPVLVANFATPADLPLGPHDAGDPSGLTHRLAAHNAALAERVHQEPDIYVWDYAGLVREVGSRRWSDCRLRLLARATVAADRQPEMARHLVRTISALRRRPAKCLVLDLDNTLWGGVVGDDGLEGLQLGDDWPGSPFKEFQRAVLGLRDRGVLLAVASKNDESVAENAIRTHPEMLIGWDDLAAVRINWDPKSVNIRSIAEELNIGTDALVLFDDNPVERAEVEAALPEVGVVDVPADPARYREALFASGFFDQPALSNEDRGRADMYRAQRTRAALQKAAPSLEDFLEGLEMEAEVSIAGSETLARISQLVAKTNQFNLTTRRHTPADVARMAQAENWTVAWLRLRDRLGDQGLVCVGILRRHGEDAHIDTFLMSCRVMNRGVERAMMSYLAERASEMGCRSLVGEYRPTAKNHMVAQFYPELGFLEDGTAADTTCWRLAITQETLGWPTHIRRSSAVGDLDQEAVT
ncbi:MAG: HAD-IIIC family phosphatase [Gemmatimonadota bacterium]|jgi:FkbH-like protein